MLRLDDPDVSDGEAPPGFQRASAGANLPDGARKAGLEVRPVFEEPIKYGSGQSEHCFRPSVWQRTALRKGQGSNM